MDLGKKLSTAVFQEIVIMYMTLTDLPIYNNEANVNKVAQKLVKDEIQLATVE